MFNFKHRGIVASFGFNEATVELEGANGAYGKTLVSGAPVALGADGVVAATGGAKFLGFLVEGLQENVYQNSSALASGLLAVTVGNCIADTDAVTDGIVFAKGDSVYVDAVSGLLTNVAEITAGGAENGPVIGVAFAATTAEAPAVTVVVI